MTRRLMAVTDTPQTGVVLGEPTADDLVAFLQARPDLAVEVLSTLRVAKAWTTDDNEGRGEIWERRLPDPCGGTLAMVTHEPDGGWRAMLLLPGDPDDDEDAGECVDGMVHHRTRESAIAAADAALAAAGWSLAGKVTP